MSANVLKCLQKRKKDISTEEIIIQAKPEVVMPQTKTNEQNYAESYKSFIESKIYLQIISSFDGLNILTKNVQEHNKLCLSSKDLIKIIKTGEFCNI